MADSRKYIGNSPSIAAGVLSGSLNNIYIDSLINIIGPVFISSIVNVVLALQFPNNIKCYTKKKNSAKLHYRMYFDVSLECHILLDLLVNWYILNE